MESNFCHRLAWSNLVSCLRQSKYSTVLGRGQLGAVRFGPVCQQVAYSVVHDGLPRQHGVSESYFCEAPRIISPLYCTFCQPSILFIPLSLMSMDCKVQAHYHTVCVLRDTYTHTYTSHSFKPINWQIAPANLLCHEQGFTTPKGHVDVGAAISPWV